jgi:hypothetical protein
MIMDEFALERDLVLRLDALPDDALVRFRTWCDAYLAYIIRQRFYRQGGGAGPTEGMPRRLDNSGEQHRDARADMMNRLPRLPGSLRSVESVNNAEAD